VAQLSTLEIMSRTAHWGTVSTWHHRLLGGLWAICGIVVIGNMILSGRWSEYQFWIVLTIASSYIATGIGFTFGRTWARRTMAALVVLAALFFLDMLLMSGWGGNRAGVSEMLIALGIAGYTLAFLAISAAWHSQGLS
jgi:hypothetical protein